jgi:CHAT domain-containing protein
MMSGIYGDEVDKSIGPTISKADFRRIAGRYRIIHLATHGILVSKNPMESSIVLGSKPLGIANKRAGKITDATKSSDKLLTVSSEQLLSAREVMELRLRADLVVLSACHTAGGGVSEGEGMIGLTWAFAAAGVPTVVASQWAVSDRTTADLMQDFHRRLQTYRQKAAPA